MMSGFEQSSLPLGSLAGIPIRLHSECRQTVGYPTLQAINASMRGMLCPQVLSMSKMR